MCGNSCDPNHDTSYKDLTVKNLNQQFVKGNFNGDIKTKLVVSFFYLERIGSMIVFLCTG